MRMETTRSPLGRNDSRRWHSSPIRCSATGSRALALPLRCSRLRFPARTLFSDFIALACLDFPRGHGHPTGSLSNARVHSLIPCPQSFPNFFDHESPSSAILELKANLDRAGQGRVGQAKAGVLRLPSLLPRRRPSHPTTSSQQVRTRCPMLYFSRHQSDIEHLFLFF